MCGSMADIQLRQLRLGEKRKKRRNHRAKISWPALLHRAAIKKKKKNKRQDENICTIKSDIRVFEMSKLESKAASKVKELSAFVGMLLTGQQRLTASSTYATINKATVTPCTFQCLPTRLTEQRVVVAVEAVERTAFELYNGHNISLINRNTAASI